MQPFLSSMNDSLEKTSEPKIKRKGDYGSPCLNPLSEEKKPKGLPFSKMEKEAKEMQVLIREIQIGLNPNFSKIANRKFYSILSKAFSISILRNIKPHFPLLGLKECKGS
jgi:hypothetical protein